MNSPYVKLCGVRFQFALRGGYISNIAIVISPVITPYKKDTYPSPRKCDCDDSQYFAKNHPRVRGCRLISKSTRRGRGERGEGRGEGKGKAEKVEVGERQSALRKRERVRNRAYKELRSKREKQSKKRIQEHLDGHNPDRDATPSGMNPSNQPEEKRQRTNVLLLRLLPSETRSSGR